LPKRGTTAESRAARHTSRCLAKFSYLLRTTFFAVPVIKRLLEKPWSFRVHPRNVFTIRNPVASIIFSDEEHVRLMPAGARNQRFNYEESLGLKAHDASGVSRSSLCIDSVIFTVSKLTVMTRASSSIMLSL